jgi:hypothetical protein
MQQQELKPKPHLSLKKWRGTLTMSICGRALMGHRLMQLQGRQVIWREAVAKAAEEVVAVGQQQQVHQVPSHSFRAHQELVKPILCWECSTHGI